MKHTKHKGKIYNQPNEKYNPMDCKWVNKQECEEELICPECSSNRILEHKDYNQCRLCWHTWGGGNENE
jgi:hypothetical protein